jgi:hypothetical protein
VGAPFACLTCEITTELYENLADRDARRGARYSLPLYCRPAVTSTERKAATPAVSEQISVESDVHTVTAQVVRPTRTF